MQNYPHLEEIKKIIRKRIVNEWFDNTEEGKQEKLLTIKNKKRMNLTPKENGVWFVVEGCGEFGESYDDEEREGYGCGSVEVVGGDRIGKPIFVEFTNKKNHSMSFIANESDLKLYHIPDTSVWYENLKLTNILKY